MPGGIMKKTTLLLLTAVLCTLIAGCGGPGGEFDDTSELVQSSDWWAKLPRPGYADLRKAETSQWWFEVYSLPADVYAIYEPYQFEEAISYLVLGNDRAILIDTGTGIGDLRKVVEELTTLPVTVVNTHAHYDHIGDNHQFEEIAIYNNPVAINRLLEGVSNEDLQRNIRPTLLWKGLPEEFDPATWTIPSVEPNYLLDEGTVIDLGGRSLEVIYTPGHSPGEICLLDRANRLLFTGDMFFPGPLYAFGDDVDIDVYVESFKKLNDRLTEYDHLLSGHNEPWIGSEVIPRVLDAFNTIDEGKGRFNEEAGLRRYFFEGFDIIIRSSMAKDAY
ncbi:MBL fold metallo-hydrolase [candidate division KSB1 bacterium]